MLQLQKNLFVRDKKKNFFLITLQAQKAIDLKSVAKQIGAKGSLSFAKPEDLKAILNLTPGSVNPFGLLYTKNSGTEVKFFLDSELYDAEAIGIHPMRNDMTVVLAPKDLEKLLQLQQQSCNLIHF